MKICKFFLIRQCFFCVSIYFFCGLNAVVSEKPIVLLITSYNNSNWYKRNLDSAFNQNYSNYRIVYVDDCSSDDTGGLVEHYVTEHGRWDRFTLIRNKNRLFKMENFYNAVHQYCDDDDIILDLDGDDWFKHNDVLKIINEVYANPDVWLTYGSYICHPGGSKGECCAEIPSWVIEKGAYRDYRWATSHQRSFYAWLFKLIKREDFMYKDKFISAATDLAYMFPMLEMSGGRFKFIRDILYVYNLSSSLNIHKTSRRAHQLAMDNYARKHRKRYSKLDASMSKHQKAPGQEDFIV